MDAVSSCSSDVSGVEDVNEKTGLIGIVTSIASLAAVAMALQFASNPPADDDLKVAPVEWTSLFDGRTLDGWKITEFGGEGEITVEDGAIFMDYGADLTGLHRDWPLSRTNYDVELEAKKVEGNDFFVGLTFPVGEEQDCSLILGGWGGGVCGLSSIDGYDASENETTDYRSFKLDQWYKVRVRVTETTITVWIDDDEYLVVDREGKKFAVRFEVERSKPFGICSFQTQSMTRNIRARSLSESEVAAAEPSED